jgi:hypothetical protein
LLFRKLRLRFSYFSRVLLTDGLSMEQWWNDTDRRNGSTRIITRLSATLFTSEGTWFRGMSHGMALTWGVKINLIYIYIYICVCVCVCVCVHTHTHTHTKTQSVPRSKHTPSRLYKPVS